MATATVPTPKLPADLKPGSLTVLVDEREKHPWDLQPMRMASAHLTTADYMLAGLEREVCVERKEFSDLIGCVGGSRKRFDEEIKRMLAFPHRIVIVEGAWSDVLAGNWRSRVPVQAARNSILGWQGYGVPIHFSGNRANAQRDAFEFLYLMARRYWRRLRAMGNAVFEPPGDPEHLSGEVGPEMAS